MATRDALKNFFLRGAKPTAGQFASLIDSFWHKDEDSIPVSKITNLSNTLAGKAATEDLQTEATTRAAADEDLQLQINELAESGGIGYTAENVANKNVANGYAGLDETGKVSADQLPSYVDDVLEFANFAALPSPGEAGKIYITIDNNNEYRWSGSTYIQIVASPGTTDAVPEGATNKYFTVTRVLNSILTGIGFGTSTAVAATDSVLQALGKLQAQITALFKIPVGGTAGQILAKNSNTDGDVHWINAPVDGAQGPAGVGVPNGGAAGQILAKNSATDGDTHWINAPSGGGGGSSEPSGQIKSFRVDYGAVGDGVSDDLTAINNALLSENVIEDSGDFFVSAAYDNKYGTPINGNVRILKNNANGGKQQLNSYADKFQHVFGTEYLSYFHKKLIANRASAATTAPTPINVVLTGDSTTFGDISGEEANYNIGIVMTDLASRDLIPAINFLNHGQGGKTTQDWLDTYLAADLAANPDVLVIRWGINDTAGITPRQLIDKIDTGLSTIRGNANYTKEKLSIVLCSMSTTTDDNLGHKGEIFNEEYNKGLRTLARKYACCYMDVYAMWQDARNGQDYISAYDAGRPNELIHPAKSFKVLIACATYDILFPKYYRNSPLRDGGFSAPTMSKPFSYYPIGISYDFVTTDGGWPINGSLVSHKSSLTSIQQTLMNIGGADPIMYVRSGYANSWSTWKIVPFGVVNPLTNRGFNNPAASTLPNSYPDGITYDFGLTDNGFPINGFLITNKTGLNGFAKQEISSYDGGAAMYIRGGYANAWQAWKQVTLV
ncbi:GDSL-type esterase/lipase family protein [Mucilaginibacter rubeus]|uniref:SGNH/GDSL hydrolase family protein n=1 Tax=Mucilaginibacter rubeus TaxID=2027860 RepID=A0A5C1I5K1_9SPHI|nr:GDSL-type esterase/lipase family protein [Mucilaginibacter rubeus]QEM13492.1 SGNH/GDSL hydrolase family protein [Mucilaginibacter rubeus]